MVFASQATEEIHIGHSGAASLTIREECMVNSVAARHHMRDAFSCQLFYVCFVDVATIRIRPRENEMLELWAFSFRGHPSRISDLFSCIWSLCLLDCSISQFAHSIGANFHLANK